MENLINLEIDYIKKRVENKHYRNSVIDASGIWAELNKDQTWKEALAFYVDQNQMFAINKKTKFDRIEEGLWRALRNLAANGNENTYNAVLDYLLIVHDAVKSYNNVKQALGIGD